MTRINVSLKEPPPYDKALTETLDVIDAEERVGGAFGAARLSPPEEVIDLIQVLNTRAGPPFLLDLIAHALNGELQLGTWSITGQDTNFKKVAKDAPAMILGVRLLGCYTALTGPGQAAMRLVKDCLKVPVRGATGMLYASDFDAYGFHTPTLLIEVDDLPAVPEPISAKVVKRDFERLPRLPTMVDLGQLRNSLRVEAPDVLAVLEPLTGTAHPLTGLDSLFNSVAPDIRSAPGLLCAPDHEVLFQGASGQHRATSLLGGHLIRVYPLGHPYGVVLRRI